MGSPTTGSKPSPHETMKCGYVCTKCRDSHPKQECMVDRICPVTNCKHEPMNLLCHAYMCRNCTRFSDDLSSFKREPCSMELVVDGEAPERPWPVTLPALPTPKPAKLEAPSTCPERSGEPTKPVPSSKPGSSERLQRTTKPIETDEDEELALALSLAQEDLEQLLLLRDLQAEEERLQGLLVQKYERWEPADAYICISSAFPHASNSI